MSWNLKQAPTQKGRIAIVTGANIGLGYETALGLAAKGCSVVLACRNIDKAEAAKASILAQHPKAVVDCMALDLASLKSVRKFAAAYKRRHARLDLLINNAGIMMPPFALSEDGFESQLAANYLGHFALTGLLLPLIVKTPTLTHRQPEQPGAPVGRHSFRGSAFRTPLRQAPGLWAEQAGLPDVCL